MRREQRGRRRREAGPALVAIVGAVLAPAACSREPSFVPPPPPAVTVGHPEIDEVTVYGEAPGRIEALQSVELLARVGGFIEEIAYADGQFVEAGRPLFRIERAPYEAAVQRAEAALASARAAAELASARLERLRRAAEQDAVNEIELIEATARRDGAVADVDAAEAALALARLDLAYTEVVAPFRGRISEASVDLGDYVTGGGQLVLAEVTSLDPVYVYWNASERDVLAFLADEKELPRREDGGDVPEDRRIAARVRLADGSVYPHEGYVDYVSPRIDPATGTLRVRARLPNPDLALFPGQFARVMVARYAGEAMLVPEVAVLRDVVGPYVLVVDDEDVVARRDVVLGELLGPRRIVLEHLDPDDRIVTAGVQRARPGLRVDPSPAPASEP